MMKLTLNKIQQFFLAVAGILAVNSCAVTKEKEINQDLIIIGRNCGMCQGTCFRGFQIMGDKVQVIEAASSGKLESATLKPVTEAKEKQFRELLSHLPSVNWPENERIGCPDCHDQCGIYVTVMKDSTRKLVLIDPDEGTYPKEMQDFVSRAKALLWE